jgi:hypothetical protein
MMMHTIPPRRSFALAIALLGALTFAALAADPTGTWLYQGMTVSVTNCGGGLCATNRGAQGAQ